MQASTIILIEHRFLDAVIHGMHYLVRNVRLGAKPNFEVFRAMLDYIDTFPERFHHPNAESSILQPFVSNGARNFAES